MDKLEEIANNESAKSISLGKRILYLTPGLVALGGLAGWGICANYDCAPSGVALFGISVFCSIGLAQLIGPSQYDL
jgi:hypothetical protein